MSRTLKIATRIFFFCCLRLEVYLESSVDRYGGRSHTLQGRSADTSVFCTQQHLLSLSCFRSSRTTTPGSWTEEGFHPPVPTPLPHWMSLSGLFRIYIKYSDKLCGKLIKHEEAWVRSQVPWTVRPRLEPLRCLVRRQKKQASRIIRMFLCGRVAIKFLYGQYISTSTKYRYAISIDFKISALILHRKQRQRRRNILL